MPWHWASYVSFFHLGLNESVSMIEQLPQIVYSMSKIIISSVLNYFKKYFQRGVFTSPPNYFLNWTKSDNFLLQTKRWVSNQSTIYSIVWIARFCLFVLIKFRDSNTKILLCFKHSIGNSTLLWCSTLKTCKDLLCSVWSPILLSILDLKNLFIIFIVL